MPDNRIDEAYRLYQSGMSLKDIAEQFGVSPATVRSWKSRYKWGDLDPPKKPQQKKKCNATQRDTRNATQEEHAANMLQPLMDNDSLNEQQKLFCIYYIQSFNGAQSYKKAYGCIYATAMANSSRLLGSAKIAIEIARLKAEKYKRAYLEPKDIFQSFMDIAFADMGDYIKWGQEFEATGAYTDKKTQEEIIMGRMINRASFEESSEVNTSIVSEIKQGKNGTSIKLHDKMRALDWLAEHIGMATPEQRQKMELMAVQTKKVKGDITRAEGDDTELSKLDQLLEGLDDQSHR